MSVTPIKTSHKVMIVVGTANVILLLHPDPPRPKVDSASRTTANTISGNAESQMPASEEIKCDFAPVFNHLHEIMGYIDDRGSGSVKPLRTRFPTEPLASGNAVSSVGAEPWNSAFIPFDTVSWNLNSGKGVAQSMFPINSGKICMRASQFAKRKPGVILPQWVNSMTAAEPSQWCDSLGLQEGEASSITIVKLVFENEPQTFVSKGDSLEDLREVNPRFEVVPRPQLDYQISLLSPDDEN